MDNWEVVEIEFDLSSSDASSTIRCKAVCFTFSLFFVLFEFSSILDVFIGVVVELSVGVIFLVFPSIYSASIMEDTHD